jgi:hypothetical protein
MDTTLGHHGDVDAAGGDGGMLGAGGSSARGVSGAGRASASDAGAPDGGGLLAGGVHGARGSGDAGSFPDAPTLAQWNCEGQRFNCEQQAEAPDWVHLDSTCPVDPTRPRSRDDCKPGEWFECDAALFHGATVEVTCRCVTELDAGDPCELCDTGRGEYQPIIACSHGQKRCGCAITKKY